MYPTEREIAEALLRHIYEHGGSKYEVHASETYEPLAGHFSLAQEKRDRTLDEHRGHGGGRRVWNNMVRWAKKELKDQSYLVSSSSRGIWCLSEKGVKAAERALYDSRKHSPTG